MPIEIEEEREEKSDDSGFKQWMLLVESMGSCTLDLSMVWITLTLS